MGNPASTCFTTNRRLPKLIVMWHILRNVRWTRAWIINSLYHFWRNLMSNGHLRIINSRASWNVQITRRYSLLKDLNMPIKHIQPWVRHIESHFIVELASCLFFHIWLWMNLWQSYNIMNNSSPLSSNLRFNHNSFIWNIHTMSFSKLFCYSFFFRLLNQQ